MIPSLYFISNINTKCLSPLPLLKAEINWKFINLNSYTISSSKPIGSVRQLAKLFGHWTSHHLGRIVEWKIMESILRFWPVKAVLILTIIVQHHHIHQLAKQSTCRNCRESQLTLEKTPVNPKRELVKYECFNFIWKVISKQRFWVFRCIVNGYIHWTVILTVIHMDATSC